MVAQGNTSAAL